MPQSVVSITDNDECESYNIVIDSKNQFGFDERTIRAFTAGDCWRLAIDLHLKLGFPIFVITDLEIALTDLPSRYFHHMVVQNPLTGRFLDVEGEHTEATLLLRYGQYTDSPVACNVTDELDMNLFYITAFPELDESEVSDLIIAQLGLHANVRIST